MDTEPTRCAPPPTPVLWVAFGFLGGQLFAPLTPGSAFPFAAAIAALARVAYRDEFRHRVLIAVALVAAALGHLQLDRRLRPTLPPQHVVHLAGDALRFRGLIADRPRRQPSGLRFVLEVDAVRRGGRWHAASGRILLTTGSATRRWRRGDRLSTRLRLRRPRNFGNPAEFNYEAYLARRRIYATGFAASDRDWRRLPRFAPPARIDLWREQAAAVIGEVLDDDLQPIAAALVLGEAVGLPPNVRERYAIAGVSHILAISGLHIGLVAAAAYAAARWLLARSESLLIHTNLPKLASAISAAPVALYAALAQGSVATTRAATMAALIIAAILLDRPRDWLVGLAIAALVISIGAPGSLFEISFQLSFTAVLAIVLAGRRLHDLYNRHAEARLLRLRGERRLQVERWLVLSAGITICAVLGTAPLTLYHFHRMSTIGLLSNTLVVPLLGFLTVSIGLCATLAVVFDPGISALLFALAAIPLRIGDWLVTRFAAIPGASVHPFTPTTFELLLLYAALALPLVSPRRLRAALCIICVGLVGADAASWYHHRYGRSDLRLTFLSVGQGDSALVEFPGSHTMLIDGGGVSASFDIGERVIAPALWRRRIHRIDTMVLSHPDFDHYGGLSYIARHFQPGELWHTGARATGTRYSALLATLRERDIPALVAVRGSSRRIDGVTVEVHHPSAAARQRSNDHSLTLRLSYGNVAVLLPGDLESRGERVLVAHRDDLRSTVLKVPHHGSRSSSSAAFVAAVDPSIAVISSGYRNRYDMPHREIVRTYEERRTLLHRTDRDGAVELRIRPDGRIVVKTGRDRKTRILDIGDTGRPMAPRIHHSGATAAPQL